MPAQAAPLCFPIVRPAWKNNTVPAKLYAEDGITEIPVLGVGLYAFNMVKDLSSLTFEMPEDAAVLEVFADVKNLIPSTKRMLLPEC